MNYIKKLCILKQLSSGFALDGKGVSALMTAEQFGDTQTFTLASVGLADLSDGRYVCIVCDTRGERELFDVLQTEGFSTRRTARTNIADGFGCLLCHVCGRVVPVAFGKSGEGTYDIKKLCAILAAREQPQKADSDTDNAIHDLAQNSAQNGNSAPMYDDEIVATENYYEFERKGENDEQSDGTDTQTGREQGIGADEDAQSLFRLASSEKLAKDEEPCYYDQVKNELTALFERFPAEQDLAECIPCSKWVKVTFARNKYYTVGVICDESKAKYICYGVPAERRDEPPAALKGFCSYLPKSIFDLNGKGYWMMFQDAETGHCVKIAQN